MTETDIPSKKVGGRELTLEVGVSGTNLLNGQIMEEYNSSLLGTTGLEVYDKMAKSDAQVHATLLYCELPILSTKWRVDAARNEDGQSDPQDEEIAKFVRQNLFEWMDTTFHEFLREVLTMLRFGHSVFEVVWSVDKEDGAVWLKKMGWRKPTTIEKWETELGQAGITQQKPQGGRVSIPADKLVIFTLRREGDNYEGQSVLRTAYRHWYLKDRLYRFDSIKHERQSLGILKVTVPPDATAEDETKALQIISRLRNIEAGGFSIPGSDEGTAGWEAEFMDMKAGTTSNLEWSIKHHDEKIATNILAQFMQLGSDGGGGSYALSEDQSSLFLQSQGSTARYICDTINRHLIKKMVDYNFETDRYPTLEFDPLGQMKLVDYMTAVSSAAGAGLLTPDQPTEAIIRERLQLPPRSQEDAVEDDPLAGLEDEETSIAEDPTDDAEDDGLDDDVAEDDEETTDLSEVFFSEIRTLAEAGLSEAGIQEVYELAAGTVSAETKQKISDALKAYWDRKGRKQPDAPKDRQERQDERVSDRGGDTKDLLQKKDQLVSRIEQTRASITTISDSYRAAIDGAKSTAEKKRLRAERKAIITPLQQFRRADIQTRVGVNKVLRARRRELSRKVKALRAALKDKRIGLKDAIGPLRTEVASNNAKIKELRAMKKGKKGPESSNLKAAIQGLLEDNQSVRDAAKGMRDDFAGEREKTQTEIEQERKGSGFYSEHRPPGDPMFFQLSQLLNNETIIQLQNEVEPLQLADVKKKGLRTNDYERRSWRPLTLAERKVNFSFLDKSMKKGTEQLNDRFTKAVARARQALLDQVRFAVKYNDVKALGKVAVPKDVMKAMSQALTDVQKEMFEVGKRTAAQELGVPVPPTSAEVRGAMRVQNDAIAGKIAWNLEAVAVRAATEAIQKAGGGSITDTTQKAAMDAVTEAIDGELKLSEEQEVAVRLCEDEIDSTIALAEATANTLSVTGSVNMGRGSIFARYPEMVYGFQFSAILDARTTYTCMSLDGMVVRPGSSEYVAYSPPRHPNCRSIWVAIMQEETFKPDFTDDVPESIPTNKSAMDAPAMRAPVVSEYTSPKTVALINEEIKTRAAKVAEYQAAGTFANRVTQHKEALSALEQGLRGADVGLKQALKRRITLEDGGEVRTPTGYVYHAAKPGEMKVIERKGLVGKAEDPLYFGVDGSVAGPAGAEKGTTVLYRAPAGEVSKLAPKVDPDLPPGDPTFYVEQSVPADVLERWDEIRKEWIPVRPRGADLELAEVFRGLLMAEGIRLNA